MTVLPEQSIHGKLSTHTSDASLMLRSNYHMCWVTQRQCRSRQMWKIFTNSPCTITFCLLQKMTVLPEQSIHGKISTHKDVLLC